MQIRDASEIIAVESEEPITLASEQKLQHRRVCGKVLTVILFLCALTVVFFTVNYFFSFFTFSIKVPFLVVNDSAEDIPGYVMSYLSKATKESVHKDVLLLMQGKRDELLRNETELQRLEEDKKSFLDSMNRKKEVFQDNISIVDEKEAMKSLRSAAHLNRIEIHFQNETERRIEKYLSIYQQKKNKLLDEKERIKQELRELTKYMQSLESEKGIEKLTDTGSLFVMDVKRRAYERFLFYVKREEYGKALKVLDGMEFDESELKQIDIVRNLITILDEYKRRLTLLESGTLFEDIKLSYLEENYKKTLSSIEAVDSEAFLSPMLGDLRNVLYRNMRMKEEIGEEIGLKGEVKVLKKKAVELERRGEYDKAVKIYEDLLILDLPSYDREYVISKIHSIMAEAVRNDIKREDNTRAIKYLDTARDLYREGREKEAFKVYKQIVTECSNSDYVEEAISTMLEITAE